MPAPTLSGAPVDVHVDSARLRVLAPALAVGVTLVLAVSRVLVTPSFYFTDDTQSGTIGQWYALGQHLLAGRLPLLDPHAWTAGNYLAEGQWGLFNPPIWLIAVVSTTGIDLLVLATAVKVILLGVLCLGVYLLARSFGASPVWSAAAGVLAPLAGFTVYMDAASWTMGLFAAAVFPWSWWGLRRLVEERRGPLPFLIATAVLITLGYVFGVIMLVVVLVESLIRHAVRRNRRAAMATLLASVYGGLLTVAVFLPGLLTAPVTVREGFLIENTGFLNADLGDLAATSTATTTATIGAWGTGQYGAPLVYIAWIIPVIAMLLPAPRDTVRRLVPLLVFGGLSVLIVTAPSEFGPLRWPIRFMPYLALAVVVLFAVLATRSFPARVNRRGLVIALAVLAAMSWFSMVIAVTELRRVVLSVVIQVIGILVLYVIARRRRPFAHPAEKSRAGAVVVAAVAGILVVPQMLVFPASPLPQLGVVSSNEQLTSVLDDGVDDAIVVGNIYAGWRKPETFGERLVANQWYFSPTAVSSLYTVLPHERYVLDLCADLRGSTCPEALETLWSEDQATGAEVATLLGVNTILAINVSFPDGFPDLPDGWEVGTQGQHTTTFVRRDPVPTAGTVAWSGAGTDVEVLDVSDLRVELRVDSVGTDPSVVLSRLNWPGYTVSGAGWADPVRGYLLTLDLSGTAPGSTVVVEFRPPGWTLELGALIAAIVILICWPVARAVVSRRRKAAPAPAGQRDQ